MKTQQQLKNRPVPYLYERFEVSGSFPNPLSNIRSSAARVLNSLAFKLNSETYLPKYVIMIPDRNIVDHLKYTNWGMSTLIKKITKWLVNQVDRSIGARHEELKNKNPGAIDSCTIVWVAMIKRPCNETTADTSNHKSPTLLSTVRRKFNNILEEILSQSDSDMKYMITDDLTRSKFFDS